MYIPTPGKTDQKNKYETGEKKYKIFPTFFYYKCFELYTQKIQPHARGIKDQRIVVIYFVRAAILMRMSDHKYI